MEERNNVNGIFAVILFFFFFTSFLLATMSTFSQIPTHTYISFSTCFRAHLLLEALLTSPSWWTPSSPPHLWKQLVPCHITLVNIALGLVKSVLEIVLSLPQIRVPSSAQRYQNPFPSWKVGSSKITGWLACRFQASSQALNMWLLAARLIVDLPSWWDEPANRSYFDPLASLA